MTYRRFGRTGLAMPVFTCGGMRYQHSWQDENHEAIPAASHENVAACVRRALAAGINHLETARGYGTSEYQLGLVLPSLPRQSLIVQTKVAPGASADDFRRTFELSLRRLRLDYVDLLAVHGINNPELLEQTLHGGTLQALKRIRAEGLARHVGFSTHGDTATIVKAIETDEFDYVNLHWFWVDPSNLPAIAAAARHDMGVFIISPSDKGGKLYDPPPKLVQLCAPFTPMGFNDLFCLADPRVHTLSHGVARPSDFDAHLAILPDLPRAREAVAPIVARLDAELRRVFPGDWVDTWAQGLPEWQQVPGEVNLFHTLRLYTLAKALDMVEYGKMRYNLLGNGGHWFPGRTVDQLDWARLPQCLAGYRHADRVPAYLREAHALFAAAAVKRLSQS